MTREELAITKLIGALEIDKHRSINLKDLDWSKLEDKHDLVLEFFKQLAKSKSLQKFTIDNKLGNTFGPLMIAAIKDNDSITHFNFIDQSKEIKKNIKSYANYFLFSSAIVISSILLGFGIAYTTFPDFICKKILHNIKPSFENLKNDRFFLSPLLIGSTIAYLYIALDSFYNMACNGNNLNTTSHIMLLKIIDQKEMYFNDNATTALKNKNRDKFNKEQNDNGPGSNQENFIFTEKIDNDLEQGKSIDTKYNKNLQISLP